MGSDILPVIRRQISPLQVNMNSLWRLPGNAPVPRFGAPAVTARAAVEPGLTGFLRADRMESVGKEIWPEGGREGYRS